MLLKKLMLINYSVVIPPSAVMAGVYAKVDSSRGVWKAPANVGVKLCSSTNSKNF